MNKKRIRFYVDSIIKMTQEAIEQGECSINVVMQFKSTVFKKTVLQAVITKAKKELGITYKVPLPVKNWRDWEKWIIVKND